MNFHQRFRRAVQGKDVTEVCRLLKISRTTFNRWVTGISSPHQFGREAVFDALKKLDSK